MKNRCVGLRVANLLLEQKNTLQLAAAASFHDQLRQLQELRYRNLPKYPRLDWTKIRGNHIDSMVFIVFFDGFHSFRWFSSIIDGFHRFRRLLSVFYHCCH